MKRLSLAICTLALGATLFTSCEKEETASPLTIDKTQTATMKGYLFADLDLTKAGLEVVPAGVKVFGYITNADILDNSSNGLWKDTVEVATDGSYSFTFPIGFTSSTLTIVPLAFESEQVQGYGVYDTTLPKVFSNSGTTSASATAGGVIPQLTYTGAIRSDYQQITKISGKLLADLSALIDGDGIGNEVVPSNITVTLYSDGWVKTFTTTTDGSFDIEVPANQKINIDCEFTYNYVVDATKVEASTYKKKGEITTTGTSVTKDLKVYFTRTKI